MRSRTGPLQLKVERALFLQKGEIAEDVLLDLLRLGFGIDLLQIQNDLLDSVLAVATLDNFEAGAVQAEGPFRHEQDALLVTFPQAASWSQARTAVQFRRHRKFFMIPLRAGTRRMAANQDSRRRNRGRQAGPRGCHTWHAMRRGPNPVRCACARVLRPRPGRNQSPRELA